MKNKAFFMLILLFALVLAGCRQEPMEATVPTTQPVLVSPKAGLLLRQQTADEQDAQALTGVLEQLGYEVLARDAQNDQSRQNEQAVALLEAGCEILVIQPVMTTGLDLLIEAVKPSNVPMVLLDTQPEQAVLELYDRLSVLCPDETQPGNAQTQLLPLLKDGGDLNGDGTVSILVVQGPEDHLDSQKRSEDFLKGLNPETQIVLETVSGDWTQEGGRAACVPMLAKYGPDIEVLVTFGPEMGLGAAQALENGGWMAGRDMYLLSVDVAPQAGKISGAVCPDSAARLEKLTGLITALTAGEAAEKLNYIDYIPVVS